MSADDEIGGWLRAVNVNDLAQASDLIARFQAFALAAASDQAETSSAPSFTSEDVARAIVLRKLVADDTSLERLVELASTALSQLSRVLQSDRDARDDPAARANAQLLWLLEPVLLLCGEMLKLRHSDEEGKASLKLAKEAVKALNDYNVLGFMFGAGERFPPLRQLSLRVNNTPPTALDAQREG